MLPAILFAAGIGFLSIVRHYSFESFEDLALFDQILWNIRHGRGPVTTISGNMHLLFKHHFFGEHFSPILYLMAPLAGITRGPEAILVMQALFVGLAAVPAGLWASRRLGSVKAGIWAAWFWVAIPPLWVGVLYDFHMDCLVPLFFFAFLLSMHRRKSSAWLWAMMMISVKEDAAIYLFFAALVAGWIYDWKKTGVCIAIASLVYAFVVVRIVMPAFSPTGAHLLQHRMLIPADCGGILGWLQAVLANPQRWDALKDHLMHFGFFPVIGLQASLPWMLAVGIAWLSKDVWQSLITMHYPLMSYPLMFFATIEGLRSWHLLCDRYVPEVRKKQAFAVAIVFISGCLLLDWFDVEASLAEVMRSASPARARRTSESRRMLASIPSDASVAATQTTLAHVSRREDLRLMFEPIHAENIVVQTYLPCEDSYDPQSYRKLIEHFLNNGDRYPVAGATDHLLMFRIDTPDKRQNSPWYFTDFVDSTELIESEMLQYKDSEAINGFGVKIAGETPNLPTMTLPNPLRPGLWNIHVRAHASCTSMSDSVSIEILEAAGGNRVCGSGIIPVGSDGYQITTVKALFSNGRDITVETRLPESCTLWVDRIWTEQIG
ncbi:MAG: DUF2079 domain-containing protein [Thermodesulfobacteriota bacterium]